MRVFEIFTFFLIFFFRLFGSNWFMVVQGGSWMFVVVDGSFVMVPDSF
jgi:hypothetical protein